MVDYDDTTPVDWDEQEYEDVDWDDPDAPRVRVKRQSDDSDAPKVRVKRQQAEGFAFNPDKTRCPLLLVADFRFFKEMGGSNYKTTVNYLVCEYFH